MDRYETLSEFRKRQVWQCECGQVFTYQSQQHRHAGIVRHPKLLCCAVKHPDGGIRCQMPVGHKGDHGFTIFGNKVRVWK